MTFEYSLSSKNELELTSNIDFIVPLKQVGLITRSVLEAIRIFYKPRRIIVITANEEAQILKELVKRWKCGVVECIDEESFFQPNFNLSLPAIRAAYDFNRPGDQREPGWWIQQLIKLGAATQIKDISDVYVVWDGDLVPTRRWKLCEKDDQGMLRWYIAILQSDSRSEFNTREYSDCMQALTGFSPLDPSTGGTFVTHHMVFHKKYVTELLDLMVKVTESTLPWPLLIMSHSRKFYRFSEYKTYATFMLRYHPEHFYFHPLSMFGAGGLRFREANEVVEEMLASVRFSNGGLSYTQVKDFFLSKQQSNDGKCIPAYVQLDHVYGLDGVDLNLAGPIPASREKFSLRAFSQLKELKEIKSSQDIPSDLFLEPINVAVVRECGGVVDDSAIQRMTVGSVMRTPFAHKQLTNLTTPRRPLLQKYFLGAESCKSSSRFTHVTCDSTPNSTIRDSSSSSSVDSFDDDTVEGSSCGGRTPVKPVLSVNFKSETEITSEIDNILPVSRNSLFTLFAPLKAVIVPVPVVTATANVNTAPVALDSTIFEPTPMDVKTPWLRA